MTVVFVHGNPEVAAIWDPLRQALGRDDTVALSPPGFGAPVPDGFGATAAEYAAWLAGELPRLGGGPFDLVGHDWGGGHVIGATAMRPDLVRTVVTDIAGCFDPEYRWHDLAQVWRTPGEGEAMLEAMSSRPFDDRVAAYVGFGMTEAAARACAEAAGPDMSRCIIALYRSAPESSFGDLSAALTAATPRPRIGVVIAGDDHFTGGEVLARRTAERWGAHVAMLEGLGHWWMLQDPARGAEALAGLLPSR